MKKKKKPPTLHYLVGHYGQTACGLWDRVTPYMSTQDKRKVTCERCKSTRHMDVKSKRRTGPARKRS